MKCNKKKPLFRHHMGNDAQLGRFNNMIARDYPRYLDCVYICNRCHMVIHFIYVPLVQAWDNFSPSGVLRLRAKLIEVCKLWLDGKIENPAVTKEFKQQWQESYKAWRQLNPLPPRRKTGTNGK